MNMTRALHLSALAGIVASMSAPPVPDGKRSSPARPPAQAPVPPVLHYTRQARRRLAREQGKGRTPEGG